MAGRGWTTDEMELLRADYPGGDTAVLAAKLGRTAQAIHAKARTCGLTKNEADTYHDGDVVYKFRVVGEPFQAEIRGGGRKAAHVNVVCECGTPRRVPVHALKRGNTTSCGCYQRLRASQAASEHNRKTQDIDIGFRRGRWEVIDSPYLEPSPAGKRGRGSVARCRCDCGTERVVPLTYLRRGRFQSCGCLRDETCGNRRRTHGMSGSRLYAIWSAMKSRCENDNSDGFEHYGERGIKVCSEWQQFEPFRDWALANGYTHDLEIDRIDVNGGYEPANCRWATLVEQANNKRDNHMLTAWGETKNLAEWSRDGRCAVKYNTLKRRVYRGVGPEDAIATPAEQLEILEA